MVRRFRPLSERQVKILDWVADGCPDGVWADTTHKRTAYALADRGLVTVDRRRHSWSAALTESGRYYLEHGNYRPEPIGQGPDHRPPGKERGSGRDRSVGRGRQVRSTFSVSPTDLVAELQSSEGVLTVPDPALEVRAGYRRAISRAITDGLVPDGYVLRHKGRDRGDLVVRLLSRDEAAPVREQLPLIPVPESLGGAHEAVLELRDQRPELLDVEESSQQRALLILQAVAEECDRRGYGFSSGSAGNSTFQISVGEIVFAFAMFEEYTRRETPDREEPATVKYEWQRVRSTVQRVRSGRLVIRLGERYSSVSWADRKRWTLADKLPQLFAHVGQTAGDIVERRARAERERQERHRAWEAALVQAKQGYVADFNRRRLDRQLVDAARAEELRRYAARIDQHVVSQHDASAVDHAHGWSAWIRTEADRIDPFQRPEDFSYVDPEQIEPRDLDPFMPRGMTAQHPPP